MNLPRGVELHRDGARFTLRVAPRGWGPYALWRIFLGCGAFTLIGWSGVWVVQHWVLNTSSDIGPEVLVWAFFALWGLVFGVGQMLCAWTAVREGAVVRGEGDRWSVERGEQRLEVVVGPGARLWCGGVPVVAERDDDVREADRDCALSSEGVELEGADGSLAICLEHATSVQRAVAGALAELGSWPTAASAPGLPELSVPSQEKRARLRCRRLSDGSVLWLALPDVQRSVLELAKFGAIGAGLVWGTAQVWTAPWAQGPCLGGLIWLANVAGWLSLLGVLFQAAAWIWSGESLRADGTHLYARRSSPVGTNSWRVRRADVEEVVLTCRGSPPRTKRGVGGPRELTVRLKDGKSREWGAELPVEALEALEVQLRAWTGA